MTNKQFNLSEKIDKIFDFAIRTDNINPNVADEIIDKIKESVKRLKVEMCLDNGSGICETSFNGNGNNLCNNCRKINKIFGEELI